VSVVSLDDLELALRRLPGVLAVGFVETDDLVLVEVQAGPDAYDELARDATVLAAEHVPGAQLERLVRAVRREQVGQPLIETLTACLNRRSLSGPMLLVLDNCEHLVEPCARLIETLLQQCPSLRILATSRQALGVPGEAVRLLSPFPLLDPDTLDAMTSDRPYRRATTFESAVAEIRRCASSQFDPEVVRAFMGLGVKNLLRIKEDMAAVKARESTEMDHDARDTEEPLESVDDPLVWPPARKRS